LDRGIVPAIRSLPRCFIDGIAHGANSVTLPPDEQKKIRQVLRLNAGDWIAVLPGNGEIWACQLDDGASATVCERYPLPNPAKRKITLAQGLPRPEKLEEVVRMGTEVGVDSFLIFPSDRSIVKWDERKVQDRLQRLRTIAREASEVCLRPYVPTVNFVKSLGEILSQDSVIVLSETDGVPVSLSQKLNELEGQEATLVIGPEGGWSPREVGQIGTRAATMGKLIFRVDTAAISACAVALLSSD